MLVLNRTVSEVVWIEVPPSPSPQRVKVTVVEIVRSHRVRLGFDADRSVVIHRDEVQRIVDAQEGLARCPKCGNTCGVDELCPTCKACCCDH